MTTLIMSSRHSEDDQALWRAALGRGWSIVRARGITLPEITNGEVVIYVEALYGPTIAKLIGCRLLDPPEDWLVMLPYEFKKREVRLTTLRQARELTHHCFIKPPNDKLFVAQVYDSGASLPLEFDSEMAVLVADPVQWTVEYRCFCLDGRVRTLSPYVRSGVHARTTEYFASNEELEAATEFAAKVLSVTRDFTPRAIVIDVGRIADVGWAVVEANAAWGSGIYGCDPDIVLDVIRHATIREPHEGD